MSAISSSLMISMGIVVFLSSVFSVIEEEEGAVEWVMVVVMDEWATVYAGAMTVETTASDGEGSRLVGANL